MSVLRGQHGNYCLIGLSGSRQLNLASVREPESESESATGRIEIGIEMPTNTMLSLSFTDTNDE